MLGDVISEPGEIFDHRYVQRSTILWQRHQSHIFAKILIHTPDVVNEITHLMKVSKISSLEVTHRIKINICKLHHGNIHFNHFFCVLADAWMQYCVMLTNEISMNLSVPCSLL